MANSFVIDCVAIASGNGAVGISVASNADLYFNVCDATTGIAVGGSATANVYGCKFATSLEVGTGILNALQGDRSAWNTETYFDRHASDIQDDEYTYHTDPAHPPLSSDLEDGHFYVGDGTDHGAPVQMSGDATMDNTGEVTLKNTGPGATGPLGGATVAPIITIDAQGRVTALGSTTITGVTPAAHQLDGALHTVSGLTAGHVLQALTATTFGFAEHSREVLMADGVTPPDPLLTEDETDWLYEG